jgi:ligand-binding sensor domain-containing protein/signal transduction histidine kinase/DNA-binding response OmpR family regulator
MRKTLLTYFILFILSTAANAISFSFRHYKVENGLSENSVFCSLQDSKGYMWFGTKDGLNRFDGQNFMVFRHLPNDKNSIGNSFIHTLFEDKRKTLWVGTEKGIYKYDHLLNRFKFFGAKTDQGQLIDQLIYSITEDHIGNMWIASTNGLYKFEKKSQKLKVYTHNEKIPTTISATIVNSVYCDSEGTIWAGTLDGGLSRYNPNNGNFTNFSFIPNHGTYRVSVLKIREDSQGNLVLGTITEGLIFFDKKTGKSIQCPLGSESDQIYYARDVFEFSPGVYFAATESGLFVYEKATGKTTQIKSSTIATNSLSDNAVYSFSKDKEGGIWVGTYFGGVNYISPKAKGFELYTPLEYLNSISGKAVSQFCEDPLGNMWIATEDGGLNYFDVKNNTFKNYNHMAGRNSISYSNVHCLQLDGDNLWIGTFARGLNVLNTKTGKFTFFSTSHDIHSISDNNVFSVYKDLTGTIWVGTIGGLSKYNRVNNNFDRIEEPMTHAFIYDILQDDRGLLWFATYGQGLIRYNPQTRQWKNFRNLPDDSTSISHNKIISVYQDDKKRLWIGTEGGGLCQYLYDKDCFRIYDIRSGLPNNVVYTAIADHDYLWLTTNKGLVRFNPDTKNIRIFTKADGLQGDQFNFRSGYKARNGKIYLGGINGFNAFFPEKMSENSFIPPVVITNIQLFNKDVTVGEKNSPIKQNISYSDEITLNYDQSVLSFEFMALSYIAPNKNQYSYKLEGFDKEWNNIGNDHKISYTNLPPGNYTLHIKGSNNDGAWNEEGVKLRIRILPPFWATIWAYLLYFTVVVVAIYYSLKYLRQKQEDKEQIRLERLHGEKEIELYNAKLDFFTNIAHEIRTPVSLIKAPLDYIVKKHKDTELTEYLMVMKRNTNRLMALINQLMDFRKAEKASYTVSLKQTNINELLQELYESFKYSTNSRGLKFELHLPKDQLIANADHECITKIVTNLLSNAIKHASTKVSLSLITHEKSNEHYEIQVVDDGDGIHDSEKEKIFQAFYQIKKDKKQNKGTGIGLALVKLLVDIHGGNISVESSENEYTRFTVSLSTHNNIKTEQIDELQLPEQILVTDFDTQNKNHQTAYPNDELPSILVVEDNEEMNNFLVSYFGENYSVMSATNGKQAVKMLENFAPDMIISDIMMPEMDGLELSQFVKTHTLYSHIPVVLLTAKTDIKYKIEGLEHGADAYIEKPFSVEHLEAQIINLLDNREKLRQSFATLPLTPIRSIGKNKADEAFLSEITNIIEKNITNVDFSVDDLAVEIAMIRSNLYRKVKGLSGLTPNDFIRLVRLKKAVKLMQDGETRINEICFMVGFNTSSYFAKCFKNQFGILPKDFVKNH